MALILYGDGTGREECLSRAKALGVEKQIATGRTAETLPGLRRVSAELSQINRRVIVR